MSFIGTQELLMILVVALVVVGPKRLPELAKNLGKGIRNFKKATAQMRSELDESGAMDEINQLKKHVSGMADDLTPMLQGKEFDATTAPRAGGKAGQEPAPLSSGHGEGSDSPQKDNVAAQPGQVAPSQEKHG